MQGAAQAIWLLDSPVSNSGRLKTLLRETAVKHQWNWDIELAFNPDARLKETTEIIATADGVILDNCNQWFNLARCVIDVAVPDAWIINLEELEE
jgi:hypothetical protein